MPLYEYVCDACGKRFELIQKFSDPAPESCPKCGQGPVHRQLSSPAIQFKGSGWYITDYAQKGKSSDAGSASEGKSESKSESKSETKTDTKSDTKPAAKADSKT